MSEWSLIGSIQRQVGPHPQVRVGIGDDAAVLASHPRELLVACDSILDGSHFDSKTASPEQIGHKAIAVNLSDIAAMGGWPETALLALTVRHGQDHEFLERLIEGMLGTCRQFGVSLVGGDTSSWQAPLAISITIMGRPHPKTGPVLRSGARKGDLIAVTGQLGDSLSSGHHLCFTPRLAEAKLICDNLQPSSMIDISDGLASDLGHICRQSKLGACLKRSHIPVAKTLQKLAPDQALMRALSDGEDFELCFTLAEADLAKLQGIGLQYSIIGHMTAKPGLHWEDGKPIECLGFEHQF